MIPEATHQKSGGWLETRLRFDPSQSQLPVPEHITGHPTPFQQQFYSGTFAKKASLSLSDAAMKYQVQQRHHKPPPIILCVGLHVIMPLSFINSVAMSLYSDLTSVSLSLLFWIVWWNTPHPDVIDRLFTDLRRTLLFVVAGLMPTTLTALFFVRIISLMKLSYMTTVWDRKSVV